MDTRLLLLAAGYFLLNQEEEEAPTGYGPTGYGPPTPGAPGGPPGAAPGITPLAPAAPTDFYQGANPGNLTGAGDINWNPLTGVIEVLRPPYWGVVGCCKAWATAYPSVRQARAGGGEMKSPRAATNCGCKRPNEAGGRPWFMPVEQAARRGQVPMVEVAPNANARMAGEGAGLREVVRGFVFEGVVWVPTTAGRNFAALWDADPNIIHMHSVVGRTAINKNTMRVPASTRLTYKGNPDVPANADPWAVEPWAGWMVGQDRGWGRTRGATPLEADRASGRIPWDFVGPVYRAAFESLPFIELPFRQQLLFPVGGRR